MTQTLQEKQRFAYLDLLRIIAAFLVIVNHTNSLVFKALTPANATWWLSVLWYYVSKIAVPLFVMISGACLLQRRDTYRQAFGRFFRIVLALVVFSYFYYLLRVAQGGWSWDRALRLDQFFLTVWQGRITDSFWYLYFYAGMMVMLPLLQRLAGAMDRRDMRYLMAVSFGVYALWPLLAHYEPKLVLPEFFDLPLFSVYIGLFFAGHYLHTATARVRKPWWVFVALLALAASVALTYWEFTRVKPGVKYWFMDERTEPSIFIIALSAAVMLLVKTGYASRKPLSLKGENWLRNIGGCSFGIFLVQDALIAASRYTLFVPFSAQVNPFLAAILWELGVFAVALAIAWVIKRIPGLSRLL